MLYKDIIKKLARRDGKTLTKLGEELGLSQAGFSTRLRDSWNPGMKSTQDILDKLGYEIVIVPKGTLDRNKELAEVSYVPEYPEKPLKKGGK